MQKKYEVQYNQNPDFRTNPFDSLNDAKTDRQNRVNQEIQFDPDADAKFLINQLDRNNKPIDRVDL